ncbi:hypothetical protein O6H91_05G050100 [Diphasiastrum complanatum]|uniref:Uncharacterized protein n=1 Tax=Diphasiastrum complanatum TaxID=34168 RepID=A0ACC2DN49_DIPCM|nr:hypothetical protein O6H91_05G050100 [Diphasiastrum complanatum]
MNVRHFLSFELLDLLMERASPLPPCKFGVSCYQKNPEHRLKFSHPLTLKTHPQIKAAEKDAGYQEIEHTANQQIATHASGNSQEAVEVKGVTALSEHFLGKEESPTTSKSESSSRPSRNESSGLVVILVGMPGSGKSTFCIKVMEGLEHPWVRICQDVIRGGKRGTKELCIKHATQALTAGKSILVDRCNMNEQQRSEFLDLARKFGVEAHAVVLDLPLKLCIQRAMKRTAHEGGLQGANVGGPIARISHDLKLPDLKEGFTRVTICKTDTDMEKALFSYRKMASIFQSSLGCDNMEGSFDECRQMITKSVGSRASAGNVTDVTYKADLRETDNAREQLGAPMQGMNPIKQAEDLPINSYKFTHKSGITLAFPSLSTADFQFDHEKAAIVMIESVTEFLSKDENAGLELMLVDLSADSDMLLRVGRIAAELGLNEKGFATYTGDITKLHSIGGLECKVIANCANWRLKAGGGGVNMAIFRAAGEEFECATKERAKTISPGDTIVVPVPQSSPLFKDEKVTHVIHVLGPNMNLNRPHCLDGDYVKGCKILRTAYTNLFDSFSYLTKGKELTAVKQSLLNLHLETSPNKNNLNTISLAKPQGNPIDAFTVLMQSAKRKASKAGETHIKRGKNASIGQDSAGATKQLESVDLSKFGSATMCDEKQIEGSSSHTIDTDKVSKGQLSKELQHPVPTLNHAVLSFRKDKSAERDDAQHPRMKWDGWAQALRNIAFHPEQHKDSVLQITDEALIARDMYPKGKKHVLVVARVDGLDSFTDLRKEHISLLRHMDFLGQSQAGSFLQEDPTLIFRLGYHSVRKSII